MIIRLIKPLVDQQTYGQSQLVQWDNETSETIRNHQLFQNDFIFVIQWVYVFRIIIKSMVLVWFLFLPTLTKYGIFWLDLARFLVLTIFDRIGQSRSFWVKKSHFARFGNFEYFWFFFSHIEKTVPAHEKLSELELKNSSKLELEMKNSSSFSSDSSNSSGRNDRPLTTWYGTVRLIYDDTRSDPNFSGWDALYVCEIRSSHAS